VGDEKGIRKANVETRKIPTPKYQNFSSVQTPRVLENTIKMKDFASLTKTLVAKIIGITLRRSVKLLTRTYAKESVKMAIEIT
jgi:hypothetical protein